MKKYKISSFISKSVILKKEYLIKIIPPKSKGYITELNYLKNKSNNKYPDVGCGTLTHASFGVFLYKTGSLHYSATTDVCNFILKRNNF